MIAEDLTESLVNRLMWTLALSVRIETQSQEVYRIVTAHQTSANQFVNRILKNIRKVIRYPCDGTP